MKKFTLVKINILIFLSLIWSCSPTHPEPSQLQAAALPAIYHLAFGEDQGPLTPAVVGADPVDKEFCVACAAPDKKGYGPKIAVWVDGVKYTAALKIRGATSMNYPKKSFTVKFSGTEIPTINGKRYNKMILNGSYNDPSFMRQYIALSLVHSLGGLGSEVGFGVFNIKGDFRRQGDNDGPASEGPSLYQVLTDWESGILTLSPDAHIYKAEQDCLNWPCSGEFFNKESAPASDLEISDLMKAHCDGDTKFDREDFFRWVYLSHFIFDRDSLTKNYIIFNQGPVWRLYFWDLDAIFGYLPDGSIYDDFDHRGIPANKFYGRMYEKTYVTACTERYQNDYLNAYLTARAGVLNAGQIEAQFRNSPIVAKLQKDADADIKTWRRWSDADFKTHYNHMIDHMVGVMSVDVP